MKTPEECLKGFIKCRSIKEDLAFFKLVQVEAWNEAIREVAENAKTKDIVDRVAPMSIHQIIDKESILKLLKK